MIHVEIEALTSPQIFTLLSTLDVDFAARLSESVNLNEYSEKLSRFAQFVVATNENEIAGIVAFYKNETTKSIYVPYVCTGVKYRGMGIGSQLLQKLIAYADSLGFPIELEVLKTNISAIMLYQRAGFEVCGESLSKYNMIRN